MSEGDGERLIVLLEARIRDFERNMQRASGQATTNYNRMKRDSRSATLQMEQDMARSTGRINQLLASTSTRMGSHLTGALRGGLGMAGIGLSAAAIANLTSTWSDLQSQVNNAVGSISRGEEVMGRLSDMARRTYSSLTQTTQSFVDNAQALKELGYNTSQQLDLSEALNNAMVITGARGQQAEAVMRAWTQAMALGELRGDNLNTVIQSGGRLAKALADSMGVSTNELRRMGAQGQITARDMFGVTRELEVLRAEADAMPATLTDSFVLLGNSLLQFVGQADQATGATSWLAAEIIMLADTFEEAARRWNEGDVPIIKFMEAAAALATEVGLLSEEVEDNRSEIERTEDAVWDARAAFMDMADEISRVRGLDAINPDLPRQIQVVVDNLIENKISAVEARQALLDLGATNPDFGGILSQLATLAGQIKLVTTEAIAMHAALNMPGGPTGDGAGRGGAGASRRELIEKQLIGTEYVTEQERLLSLSREQLQIEQARERILKEVAAAGGIITQQEAERLAMAQVAAQNSTGGRGGGGGRGGNSDIEAIKEMIASLELERDQLGMTAVEQEKIAALRKAGAAATEEQKARIVELIEAIAYEKEAASLLFSEDAPWQVLENQMAGLESMLERGAISWEEYGQAAQRAHMLAASATLGAVGQITGALSTVFENNRAFAVANAVVNTAQGITAALALPPPMGWIQAAAVAASGAAQISTIMSAQKGSTSKPTVSGGGSAGVGRAASAPAKQEPERVAYFNFKGEYIRMSRDEFSEFVDGLVDFVSDGGGNSNLQRVFQMK